MKMSNLAPVFTSLHSSWTCTDGSASVKSFSQIHTVLNAGIDLDRKKSQTPLSLQVQPSLSELLESKSDDTCFVAVLSVPRSKNSRGKTALCAVNWQKHGTRRKNSSGASKVLWTLLKSRYDLAFASSLSVLQRVQAFAHRRRFKQH